MNKHHSRTSNTIGEYDSDVVVRFVKDNPPNYSENYPRNIIIKYYTVVVFHVVEFSVMYFIYLFNGYGVC